MSFIGKTYKWVLGGAAGAAIGFMVANNQSIDQKVEELNENVVEMVEAGDTLANDSAYLDLSVQMIALMDQQSLEEVAHRSYVMLDDSNRVGFVKDIAYGSNMVSQMPGDVVNDLAYTAVDNMRSDDKKNLVKDLSKELSSQYLDEMIKDDLVQAFTEPNDSNYHETSAKGISMPRWVKEGIHRFRTGINQVTREESPEEKLYQAVSLELTLDPKKTLGEMPDSIQTGLVQTYLKDKLGAVADSMYGSQEQLKQMTNVIMDGSALKKDMVISEAYNRLEQQYK